MSVRLRLQRFGAKKRPYYRIVAADGRSPRDGRYRELLGTYDPMKEPNVVDIKLDRVDYWLSVGAQPSERVKAVVNAYRAEKTVTNAQFVETNKERIRKNREAALAAKPIEEDAPKAPAKEEAPKAEAAAEEAPAEEAPAAEAAPAEAAGDDAAES